ncbi:MAG TPA: phosphoribosylformylglycinamidine synthase subunit PurQ [Thermoanaerobaculaceae bacterium]|nr:phosphoribosylformylglycinamidine synthase subunit PurQ [Thermoanaerobaculaceae bacterium]
MKRPATGDRGPGTGNGKGRSGDAPVSEWRQEHGPRVAVPAVGRRKRVAVVVFPGSNCDRDAMAAVDAVGGEAVAVWHRDTDLKGCGAVILPGGFSYGDYLRAGAMAAHSPVMGAVRAHAAAGGAVLGICNGFQMLLEIGLLPGAMLMNRTLRFICREVGLRVERDDLPLLAHLRKGQVLRLPIAHKDGNWFAAPAAVAAVERAGAVAFRYCAPDGSLDAASNPNGSLNAIAGLVNAAGNVLGLMPHPERRVHPFLGGEDGSALLRAVVEAA